MHFDWFTFALQTVNFAILVWLLHRFLYRPVLRLVDARRAEIEKQYAEVKAAETQAAAGLAKIKAERDGIAGERAAALNEAAHRAEEQAAARRSQADHEAAALLAGARKSLADERAAALVEARRAALDLGAEIAVQLIAEVPMTLRTEAWIERIERYLAALPKAEAQELARQLENGAALDVVTAANLPPEAAVLWRSRLRQALGADIAVDFAVEPQLLAGAELHFPNAILRFSWQSVLDAMRAEIDADDHAR